MTDGTHGQPAATVAHAAAPPTPPYSSAALVGLMDELTPQQQNVARLIGACFTVKQTAGLLEIGERAVREHIDKIVYAWDLDPTRDARTQIALIVAALAALKAMNDERTKTA